MQCDPPDRYFEPAWLVTATRSILQQAYAVAKCEEW